MRVEIKEVRTPYEFKLPSGQVLFKVEEADLAHERFDGSMGPDLTRVNFERGDGVGVLLFDEEASSVVLVEQFRFPVHRREPDGGWLAEIVAGIKDAAGPEVARKEALEETGYTLDGPLEHLSTFYLSPGGTSERMELYLAPVHKASNGTRQGGVASEGEDIRVHTVPLAEALNRVERGEIRDAKTMLALLLLEKRLCGQRG